MKAVRDFWRSLFAGRHTEASTGLVRMFEVEYANEARQMKKQNHGILTHDLVKGYLEQLRRG